MDQATLVVFLLMCSLSLGTIPVTHNSTILRGEQGVCPTAEQRNAAISQLESDIDTAIMNTVIPELQRNSSEFPVISCSSIPAGEASGHYWIQTNTGSPSLQYCDMTRTSCCNTTGWMRVANLDMTDTNQQCPSGFRLVTSPVRACGRHVAGCVSTTFQTHGIQYSKVCGKIIGYQQGSTDAFIHGTSIDNTYVDGVSLTHGQSPRKHIWTFVAAHDETITELATCPCTRTDRQSTLAIQSFIGQDYFCETGSREYFPPSRWNETLDQDPLWNGQGCGVISSCCTFNNPPWFCKTLPQPTSDDIELRLCGDEVITNEDTPIESVELYIQ